MPRFARALFEAARLASPAERGARTSALGILLCVPCASSRVQQTHASHSPAIVVGRLLNEDLHAVTNTKLLFWIDLKSPSSGMSRGYRLETDDRGRFRFDLPTSGQPGGKRRTATILADYGDASAMARLGEARAFLDLARTFAPGENDVGDLVAVSPGSNVLLLRMDDDELASAHADLRRRQCLGDHVEHELETCWLEMVRRGGDRWIGVLQDELCANRWWARISGWGAPDLELLTCTRRAQRLPDPLTLEIVGGPVFESTFPELPTVSFFWKNVDPGESFLFDPRNDTRDGRSSRCHVRAFDSSGREVAPLTWRVAGGGLSVAPGPFSPGRSRDGYLRLRHYLIPSGPDDYCVQVEYHSEADISDEVNPRGWVVSTSKPFTLRIHPRHVVLEDFDRAELEQAVWEIDVTEAVLLTEECWREGLVFAGEPWAPEDRLFRAGWKALPVLLDALQDETLGERRRAWVLGLLWDLTGSCDPQLEPWHHSIEPRRHVEEWPASFAESPRSPHFEAKYEYPSTFPIDAADQQALTERWLACRDCVVVDR